jgi:two-component system response regulator LytT
MKIKYKGPKEDIIEITEGLNQGKLEFVLFGEEYELKKVNNQIETIIGENNGDYVIINYQDIVYIESYSHEILCHTQTDTYYIKEKLYEIEGMFNDVGFIRIHKSYIINQKQIKRIIPEFNRKFKLILNNDKVVEVSRRYFVEFKQAIGMKV